MRFTFSLLLALFLCTCVSAQKNDLKDLPGAWESNYVDADGRPAKLNMIIAANHFSLVAYYPDDGEFIATLGGKWQADWQNMSVTYEYESAESSQVGRTVVMPYDLSGNILVFNGNRFWTRVDQPTDGALAGAWEITGRMQDGEMQDLSARRDGPRKTMKILSGTRFQWIAYNTETGEFKGTGGGTYTAGDNGIYAEKIEFFSRDQAKVGRQLGFDWQLEDGNWIHRGSSSAGKAIHEIWSKRR
ncbi:hypothetical protein [Lewinella sp. 4G2]|uniref:hypothetical protein n=1 Tax=Lewinella sp. 4G2 TaxID=1803372 RepID=UPI0007B4AD74|nr:hypothetical protein [Lewinella sp. 4G2]OAV46049.1 hypothetical protein A3850_017435 [Lewinella sp. 4G2]